MSHFKEPTKPLAAASHGRQAFGNPDSVDSRPSKYTPPLFPLTPLALSSPHHPLSHFNNNQWLIRLIWYHSSVSFEAGGMQKYLISRPYTKFLVIF